MSDIRETVAEVLRLDAEATEGPWDEDGIYMGIRHLGKHCSHWYYYNSDGDLIPVPLDKDAAIIAYYRTAAPALAREVQRLQGEVRIDADALVEMMEESRRVGQEAMRETCAQWLEQRGDHVWAKALRALEVSHD